MIIGAVCQEQKDLRKRYLWVDDIEMHGWSAADTVMGRAFVGRISKPNECFEEYEVTVRLPMDVSKGVDLSAFERELVAERFIGTVDIRMEHRRIDVELFDHPPPQVENT